MDSLFLEVLSKHTAGSPTDEQVKWTHLKPRKIAALLKQEHGVKISSGCVSRLLHKHGYRKRKQQKKLSTGQYARCNEQFNIIFYLMALMNCTDGPIICMDTKKKEVLGNLYRAGKCYAKEAVKVLDHDYPHLAQGKVIPHGIYDLKANAGYISIGTSHETAAFVCDNLIWWWDNTGMHLYPHCKQILVLCDSGGANSYRHFIFKKELQRAVAHIGLRVIISHYPPYASKYNPIEYRLFAPMHHAIQGVVFSSYEVVKELIGQTETVQGLTVVVRMVYEEYPPGNRANKEDIESEKILYHQKLPELNYTILP